MDKQIRELTVEEMSQIGGGADPHWSVNLYGLAFQGNSDTGAWSVWLNGKFQGSSDH